MGSGAVDDRYPQPGQENGVQGVRIAGAEGVLHRLARLLGPAGHLAHEGGLAAARAAFQDVEPIGPLGGKQVVIEGVEAGGELAPRKYWMCFSSAIESSPSFPNLPQTMLVWRHR